RRAARGPEAASRSATRPPLPAASPRPARPRAGPSRSAGTSTARRGRSRRPPTGRGSPRSRCRRPSTPTRGDAGPGRGTAPPSGCAGPGPRGAGAAPRPARARPRRRRRGASRASRTGSPAAPVRRATRRLGLDLPLELLPLLEESLGLGLPLPALPLEPRDLVRAALLVEPGAAEGVVDAPYRGLGLLDAGRQLLAPALEALEAVAVRTRAPEGRGLRVLLLSRSLLPARLQDDRVHVEVVVAAGVHVLLVRAPVVPDFAALPDLDDTVRQPAHEPAVV